MKVTYFINQYPMVSHSFIRREILALERQGIQIQRISLRGWDVDTINDEDEAEKLITTYILQNGTFPLILSVLRTAINSPLRLLSTLKLVLKLNLKTERSLISQLISLAEACHLLPLLNKYKSEHIHVHFGTNSTEVVMLANALGGPNYSFTVHGPEEFDKPSALHLPEKIKRAKFVVAISSFGRSQLFRWVDKSQWGKVKVIHCGLEETFYNIEPTQMPDIPRLICVGRLCEQKGQMLLIEACHKLSLKQIAFELVLAGDGDLRDEIEAQIEKYKLQANVHITGWISSEQVRDGLLASKGMILPSFAEGLPVVIMEAMSLRRPVLTTFVAGIPELIENGRNGWLFPAGDVDEIAKAMEDFLSTSNQDLNKIVELAFNKVTKRHNIDTETAKLINHFKSAIQDDN